MQIKCEACSAVRGPDNEPIGVVSKCVQCVELDRLRAKLNQVPRHIESAIRLKTEKLQQENANLRRALELSCNERPYETGMISLAELGKGTSYFLQQAQKERE